MNLEKTFQPTSEKDITRAIVNEYFHTLQNSIESDVIIVGGGPSGLMAAIYLRQAGKKVCLIEANNYLGGGFWIGGCFYNQATFRDPSHHILEEFGVPIKKFSSTIYTASAPHACSALIKEACNGISILSLTRIEDLIVQDARVTGVVMNWSATKTLPKQISCLDPLGIEAKVVIDATGHEAAAISQLAKRNILTIKGEAPMNVTSSEDEVVAHTGKVYEGLYACGMSLASFYGLHRMGPTFGAMLLSGKKVAKIILAEEFS